MRRDSLAVEAPLADHHEAAGASLARPPWPVELMLDALADALDDQPHRLALHLGKAFDAQDVVRGGGSRYPLDQVFRRRRAAARR